MTDPSGRPPLPPDHPDLAAAEAATASAYLHIPFCARVCPYCDFAVVGGADDRMDDYLDALEREIADEPPWRPLGAVFVGGGTPSRVPTERMARLITALSDRFGLAATAEVTLEANPEDWSVSHAEALVAAGFTRVSFGAQSFDPAVLDALGRMHTPEQAEAAVGAARAGGFRSVSLDLIFGHPVETETSWRATLERAVETDPDHVSTYSLTVEPGTELWRDVRHGAPAPDPDIQADRWERAALVLGSAGYVRYEISNHARPGHHCRYNLSVWGQGEYLAFGLGAHSFRDGVRARRVRRLDTYIDRVNSGIGPIQDSDVVAGWDAELERLMLGLRRSGGVTVGADHPVTEAEPLRRLIDLGVATVDDGRLVASQPLLTDEIIRAVLDTPQPRG